MSLSSPDGSNKAKPLPYIVDNEQILHGTPKDSAVDFFLEFAGLEYAMKDRALLKNTDAVSTLVNSGSCRLNSAIAKV